MIIPIVGADYPKIVIPLLNSAKKNIDVLMYDWRWYENQLGDPVQQFNLALVRALQRGVFVRAIVYNPSAVPFLKKIGVAVKTLSDRRVLHSKLLLIDGETVVIGSHNLTRNAFVRNLETSLALSDRSAFSRLSLFFDRLYNFS